VEIGNLLSKATKALSTSYIGWCMPEWKNILAIFDQELKQTYWPYSFIYVLCLFSFDFSMWWESPLSMIGGDLLIDCH
jgi:hypothetical protein